MNAVEKWNAARSEAERTELWKNFDGNAKYEVYCYVESQKKKQAEQVQEPVTESEQLFNSVMNGCDPNSDIGRVILSMRDHGAFDIFEDQKSVNEYGDVFISRKKI